MSASILLLVFGLSFFQPAFCVITPDGVAMACETEMECGLEADCDSPCEEDAEDEEQSGNKGCVMMACSNCTFTLVEKLPLAFVFPTNASRKLYTSDDNRVIHTCSEFWNPPKAFMN